MNRLFSLVFLASILTPSLFAQYPAPLPDPRTYQPLESQAHPGVFVVAALGDSVSAGASSTGLGENRRVNFATGDDASVGSHAARLQYQLPHLRVQGFNFAKSGATSDDLIRQAQLAAQSVPDYATILIGVNDACAERPERAYDLQRYVQNVATAAGVLIQANPAVRIRLIPAPNMRQMHAISSQRLVCRAKWALSRACRAFTSPPHDTASKENFFRLVDSYNSSLVHIANMYPANITVAWAVASNPIAPEDISNVDCFHPSVSGQQKLAWVSFGGN